jgi:hypothetical protein
MLDTCKTDVRVGLFQANFKNRFVSGHDFSRAEKPGEMTALAAAAPFPAGSRRPI